MSPLAIAVAFTVLMLLGAGWCLLKAASDADDAWLLDDDDAPVITSLYEFRKGDRR